MPLIASSTESWMQGFGRRRSLTILYPMKPSVSLPMLILALVGLSSGASREEEILRSLAQDTVSVNEFRLSRISVQGGFLGGFGSLSSTGAVHQDAASGSIEEAMNRATTDASFGADAGVSAGVFWNTKIGSLGMGAVYSSLSATGKDDRDGLRTDANTTSELVAGTVSGRLPLGRERRIYLRGSVGVGQLVLRRELNAVDTFNNRYTASTRSAATAWMGSAGIEFKAFPILSLIAEGRYLGASVSSMSRTSGANGVVAVPETIALGGDQGDASRLSAYLGVLLEFGLYH